MKLITLSVALEEEDFNELIVCANGYPVGRYLAQILEEALTNMRIKAQISCSTTSIETKGK